MAELLLDEAHIDCGQPAAAVLRGDVQGEKTQLLRLCPDGLGNSRIEFSLCLNFVLERDQLGGDEAPYGFDKHALLVAQCEIHTSNSLATSVDAGRSPTIDGDACTLNMARALARKKQRKLRHVFGLTKTA